MRNPKSRCGIPHQDMGPRIQIWLSISRSGNPSRYGQIRFRCARRALPGGEGRDSSQKHRKNIPFWTRIAAEGIAGKNSEIGVEIKAKSGRPPTSSFRNAYRDMECHIEIWILNQSTTKADFETTVFPGIRQGSGPWKPAVNHGETWDSPGKSQGKTYNSYVNSNI